MEKNISNILLERPQHCTEITLLGCIFSHWFKLWRIMMIHIVFFPAAFYIAWFNRLIIPNLSLFHKKVTWLKTLLLLNLTLLKGWNVILRKLRDARLELYLTDIPWDTASSLTIYSQMGRMRTNSWYTFSPHDLVFKREDIDWNISVQPENSERWSGKRTACQLQWDVQTLNNPTVENSGSWR